MKIIAFANNNLKITPKYKKLANNKIEIILAVLAPHKRGAYLMLVLLKKVLEKKFFTFKHVNLELRKSMVENTSLSYH